MNTARVRDAGLKRTCPSRRSLGCRWRTLSSCRWPA
jgi:hypothetical protein